MRKTIFTSIICLGAGALMGAVAMSNTVNVTKVIPQTNAFAVEFSGRVQNAICPDVDTLAGLSEPTKCSATTDDWTVCLSKHGSEELQINASVELLGGQWSR